MGHFGEPEPVADPNPKDYRQHPGFLQPILPFNNHRTYTPHQYKYVVVPVGSGALSTSGAHCHMSGNGCGKVVKWVCDSWYC